MSKDNDEETIAKTLWTETILEILYEALKRNKDDAAITEVLKEVRSKGFKQDYIFEKVTKKVDKQAASRVKTLMQRM